LILRQTALNELLPAKLAERDITIHLLRPGMQEMMDADGGGRDRAGGVAVTVTAVNGAGPNEFAPDARFTDSPFAHQKRAGTQNSVIMKGLHHRDPRPMRGIVGGWGNQQKRVVEMPDFRLGFFQNRPHFP